MKKVIVTGATGFIGVHLVHCLLNKKYIVYAVVRPGSCNVRRLPHDPGLRVLELSMDEIKTLPNLIGSADAFYHLAWEGTRAPYRDDSVLQRKNYLNSIQAMCAATRLKCKIFIGTGSQAEYGIIKGKVDEAHSCSPVSPYGWEKLHTYQELHRLAGEVGLQFIWLRIFSAYGRYDSSDSLIMSCIDKMRSNLRIELTECRQNWDYIYVGDVAGAMVRFMEHTFTGGIYNVARGEIMPLRNYVERLRIILKSHSIIKYGAVPYGPEGPVSLEPVVNKIQRELEWRAETAFEKGIWKILNGDENNAYENGKYINSNL